MEIIPQHFTKINQKKTSQKFASNENLIYLCHTEKEKQTTKQQTTKIQKS